MPNTIPVPDFGPDRLDVKSMLPGIFGYNKPRKQKQSKSITQQEFSEMWYALRMSLLDQGASESQIKEALQDLESRVNISDGPSGNRSTVDSIIQHKKQIEAMGE